MVFSGTISFQENLALAADLDSYDAKRVDEPDHDKRHAAYSTLFDVRLRLSEASKRAKFQMWATDNVFEMSFISLVVHTHMYTLNNVSFERKRLRQQQKSMWSQNLG